MKSGDAKSTRPKRDQAAILRVIRSIPHGCVASYGEIAARAGLPGRARLIGHVLRESPGDAALPWYRVLRSDGRIAFPPGSRGFREQVRHLAAEGVLVMRGRVDISRHGWDRNLDAVLWAPTSPVGRATRTRARKEAISRKKR
jgi:methylated-DNA-protein-cysteine methyltransferase related protein